ncbi:MAG: hypothetical protein QM765_31960 [Myxococcales bacterium]
MSSVIGVVEAEPLAHELDDGSLRERSCRRGDEEVPAQRAQLSEIADEEGGDVQLATPTAQVPAHHPREPQLRRGFTPHAAPTDQGPDVAGHYGEGSGDETENENLSEVVQRVPAGKK